MEKRTSERGFQALVIKDADRGDFGVVRQSSAIGSYENSVDKPGSSFLWIGDEVLFNREEVKELISYLQHWLETGDLFKAETQEGENYG